MITGSKPLTFEEFMALNDVKVNTTRQATMTKAQWYPIICRLLGFDWMNTTITLSEGTGNLTIKEGYQETKKISKAEPKMATDED